MSRRPQDFKERIVISARKGRRRTAADASNASRNIRPPLTGNDTPAKRRLPQSGTGSPHLTSVKRSPQRGGLTFVDLEAEGARDAAPLNRPTLAMLELFLKVLRERTSVATLQWPRGSRDMSILHPLAMLAMIGSSSERASGGYKWCPAVADFRTLYYPWRGCGTGTTQRRILVDRNEITKRNALASHATAGRRGRIFSRAGQASPYARPPSSPQGARRQQTASGASHARRALSDVWRFGRGGRAAPLSGARSTNCLAACAMGRRLTSFRTIAPRFASLRPRPLPSSAFVRDQM